MKRGRYRLGKYYIITLIIGTFLYLPVLYLGIIIGIVFWFISEKEIKNAIENGRVFFLNKKTELINLNKVYPNKISFAAIVDVETTGLLVDENKPTIKKVTENPHWYPRIVQLACLKG